MGSFKMRHGVIMTWLKILGWSFIFYLFLFQPIISKFIYLGVEVIIVLFFVFYRPKLFADNLRLFKSEYVFAGLICVYSLFIDLSNLNIVFLDRFLASFFQGYLVSFIFIYCISKSSILQYHLSDCLFLMCFIACSITITAVLVPSFGQFCINHATLDARERLQELFIEGGYSQYRSYGLSESLNFTYAYVLSIIGGYLLTSRFKVFTPFLLLMILVTIIFNARIAFVPLLVSLLFLVFLSKKSLRGMMTFIMTAGVLLLLALWTINTFPELNNEWGLSFFNDLSLFLTGQEGSTIGILTGSMWVIPDNAFHLIFGTGKNIFEAAINHSDVGYILQLNYGGIILLGIILFYFIFIFKRIVSKLSFRHWFTIMFIVSVLVLNFKGFYLAAIPGNRFLTFLYVLYIYESLKGLKELDSRCSLIAV